MTERAYAKAKFFSKRPVLLQAIADTIQNEYGQNCTVSRVFPAKEGDFYVFIMIYEEAT